MNALINIHGVSFSYSQSDVLKDITLTIPKGEITLILGANGVGKSTLLKILSGILVPKSGEVLYDNINIYEINKNVIAKKIAYVSQDSVFSFPFTALEVALLGRSPYIGRFEFERDSDYEIAINALRSTGILHLKDRIISEVSGGEKQLVSIARAITQQPELMVLDEPGTHLDLKHKSLILNILNTIKEKNGTTIVFATHDLSSLQNEYKNIILLKDGEIFKSGHTLDVINETNLTHIYGTNVKIFKENGNIFVSTNFS